MKSTMSLTLIGCLAVSVLPVAAQQMPVSFNVGGPPTLGAAQVITPGTIQFGDVVAQSSTQPSGNAEHSVWRAMLIGAGIGGGIGMGLGALADHSASCVTAREPQVIFGHCEGHYGMKFFGGDGAAVGALVGFLVHRHHRP